jgi:site-specific recombinase XerC
MPLKKQTPEPDSRGTGLTVPELEHSKTAVLDALASTHSRRSYKHAIEKFIAWYCSEPRIGFNRSVVVRYRSFLEGPSLSAATINLHLSAIRRVADETAESGWLSPELAIGIHRVKGVKRLGRRIGNWLTGDQAQELLNAVPQDTLRGRRDAAVIGLLLGCGLRRSEAVNLRVDQLQLRETHWVIVDMVGKGGRVRTVSVPAWCKALVDYWLLDSGVGGGKVFRRVSKSGVRQDAGVNTDVVSLLSKIAAI